MPPASTGASAVHPKDRAARLVELLHPLVTDAGYDLEDVTVTAAGRRSVVRVIVDADGGIDLDAVAAVSHVVSQALDEAEESGRDQVLPGAYVLEVSSPGTDSPLREQRHWRRAVGRLVTVQSEGRTVTGRVRSVDADGVAFALDGVERHIAWTNLGPGRVQVEFNRDDTTDDAPDGEDQPW